METDYDFGVYFQAGRVYPVYGSLRSIRVDLHGADIRGYIGVSPVKTDVPAVGNVYLRDPLASPGIQYFYFMGTIDYDIKLASVNLDIVADIAQLLDYVRVPFRVEVTDIITVHVIQIIQRTFIASHIPFVHQIHPLRIRLGMDTVGDQLVFRGNYDLDLAAG